MNNLKTFVRYLYKNEITLAHESPDGQSVNTLSKDDAMFIVYQFMIGKKPDEP